jgi:hypothetical protein
MLPGFEKLYIETKNRESEDTYGRYRDRGDKTVHTLPSTLQVVVKLQRYCVPPMASYTGRWHTEGVTENIDCVGVYYVEWPSTLTGGELKFRTTEIPNERYRDYMANPDAALSLSVPMKEGSAAVFQNTVPHRFRYLTNQTDKPLYRSFVNFFIVDPTKPLPTTDETPTNADIFLALCGRMVHDVIAIVLSFVGLTPTSVREALDLRSRAKAEMVARKSKWGEIQHGNCGSIHWLSAGEPDHYGRFPDDDRKDWRNGLLRTYEDMRVTSHTGTSSGRGQGSSIDGL